MRILTISVLLLLPVICLTQNAPQREIKENCYSAGLFYNYNVISHIPEFWYMNIYSTCETKNYEKGKNSGITFGIGGTIPIGNSFRSYVSASYSDNGIKLQNQELIPYNLNNNISYMNLTNEIEGSINSFNIQILFGYKIFKTLFISAGVTADLKTSVSIIKYTYSNLLNEKIQEFVHQFSDKRFLYFMPTMCVSYDFFFGNLDFGFIISPFVQYSFGLYDFLSKTKWKYDLLGLGISIRYTDNIFEFTKY